MMHPLSPRQVHLDFHTSEKIDHIGDNFSKENFQQALKMAHLTSITVFAKCHHGWCYYPTQIGEMHPHLKFDLLGEMLCAAHEIGVRAPIYITGAWSAKDAESHPEWRAKQKDGSVYTTNYDLEKENSDSVKPDASWITLCFAGNYAKHVFALTEEICDRYPIVDGLFYDICFKSNPCYCEDCMEDMQKRGYDPQSDVDAKAYYVVRRNEVMKQCRDILHKKHPDATIFFNGAANQYCDDYDACQTHFELEDLPTAWGGYDKLPVRALHFAQTGKFILGMTGKFHTDWGEFGGFKLPEALKYECVLMLTYGARCSIGDQLHPDGKMDLATYQNIGYAYDYVKRLEDYCFNEQGTTKLGLYLSRKSTSDTGIAKMLLETQNDFDVVYQNNFEKFNVIIFPDCAKLDIEGKDKLLEYVSKGGKVIFTGSSLVDENNRFILDIGAEYLGKATYDKDYIVAGSAVNNGMVESPVLCYSGAHRVKVTDGDVLARVALPYYSRTYKAYCSHKNTPYNKQNIEAAGMIKKGNIIYAAHSLGENYDAYGAVYHKRFFINALKLLHTTPALTLNMGSNGRARLIKQSDKNRYCLNMVYGAPTQRGKVSVIEDLTPIYHIAVKINCAEKIKRCYLPFENRELDFNQSGHSVEFVIEKIAVHQLAVLEY